MGAGTVGGDGGSGGGGEFGEFSRGFAAAEAVGVGVVLKCDEAVLVDVLKGALQTFFYSQSARHFVRHDKTC